MVCAAVTISECIAVQINFILVMYFLQNFTEECPSCINYITGFMKMKVLGEEKLVACPSLLGVLLHQENGTDLEH